MKKYIIAILSCMAITLSNAQTVNDALLFSSEKLTGTARYTAMGGAFGALGGDLSAVSENPAGSAVFNNSYATFTLGVQNVKNEVGYFNGLTEHSNTFLDVTQAGAALVFLNADEESDWDKFTLGFNYNQLNNYSDEFSAIGTNTNSIANYFVDYAQGVPLGLLETMTNETVGELYRYLGETEGYGAQQALLGYQGFIFNPVSDNAENTEYTSAVAPGTFDQDYTYISTGLNGKFSFNVATEYQDKFYFGLNLNSHFINYERYTNFYEQNSNEGSETNVIEFQNNLTTLGTGFSFQLGGIAELTNNVRVGATYKSPTWLTLSEETTQALGTYREEFDETVIVEPNVVNVFPDYKITTPSEYTGSFAYVFGDKGLISFDYSYKDFSKMKFRPKSDPFFIEQNNYIEQNFQSVSTYEIGGEYRIKRFSLRGGYRFEESPYKNDELQSALTGYSLGLGYDFGKMKLDFAYAAASQDRQHLLYASGLTDTANIEENFRNFILSLSFEL